MARIQDTADRQVTAGKWRSQDAEMRTTLYGGELPDGPHTRRTVWHYATPMLQFTIDEGGQWDGSLDTVSYSIGNGSVSDQNGMNVLFARLGMPYYFQRQGGAQIVTLDKPQYRYNVSPTDMHGWRKHIIANYLEGSPC